MELTIEGLAKLGVERKRGRPLGGQAAPLKAEVVRELELSDLAESRMTPSPASSVPSLQSLKRSHHEVAMYLARGVKPVDVSALTGYSPARLSVLQADPLFAELIAHYADMKEDVFLDTVKKMKFITDDALDMLHDRLEQDPDSFTNNMLLDLITRVGGQAGFTPVQKSIALSGNLSQQEIERIRTEALGEHHGKVQKTTRSLGEGGSRAQGSAEPSVGRTIETTARAVPQAPKV